MKKQSNLTIKVYQQIIDLMLAYDIVPGQRLVFVDLAKKLNVSRTPVNNALSILAQEGYLDFVPNQGYSVHKLTREEAENHYAIREVLEVGFVGSAIRNMNEKNLQKLTKHKTDYEKAITGHVTRKLFILDTEFHVGILNMVGNDILSAQYRRLCQKIFLRFRTDDLIPERIQDIQQEHHEIFEAIRLKDVEHAKELLRLHHKSSQKNLFPLIFPSNG